MTACAAWLAADYLARRGLPHDTPPCSHDPADCPPLPADDPKEPNRA